MIWGFAVICRSCYNTHSQRATLVPFTKNSKVQVNWGYGRSFPFHSWQITLSICPAGPPTSHHQLPHIHQDIHTCTHTPKPLNLPCHTLSVIDRVQMLSGMHAARSGGGWITLFALCSALVTYFSQPLLQLEEEQERERESDRAPDNFMFQVDQNNWPFLKTRPP